MPFTSAPLENPDYDHNLNKKMNLSLVLGIGTGNETTRPGQSPELSRGHLSEETDEFNTDAHAS